VFVNIIIMIYKAFLKYIKMKRDLYGNEYITDRITIWIDYQSIIIIWSIIAILYHKNNN